MFNLSNISLEELNLKEKFKSGSAGAFSSFEGWVRNHNEGRHVTALEYEAHEPLCRKEAEKILAEASRKFKIIEARCVHRIGTLKIGDMAVWVGITAVHRDQAFKACRYIIDEVKRRLPIWKKEFYDNGESGWVNSQQLDSGSVSGIPSQDFYARQINLPELGPQGQDQLNQAKILVVGAGGLGCSALLSLAGAGVGQIGICEYDRLQASNLHRQFLYSHQEIGQFKINLAEAKIKSLNPFIRVHQHAFKLDSANVENMVHDYDIVLDCTDNFPTKFLLNDACFLGKKPLIQAGIYQFEGHVRVFFPGSSGCLRCLWPEPPQAGCMGTCAEVGVLGAVPNIVGSVQAMEAIKWILGLPVLTDNEMIILNLLNFDIKKIRHARNPACPLCGEKPMIKNFQSKHYESLDDLTINLFDFSDQELRKIRFIDVRESEEIIYEPVTEMETDHLPLSEFTELNYTFDKGQRYVIFCAHGQRSLYLAQMLYKKGLRNIFSLPGGIATLRSRFKLFDRSNH